MGVTSVTEESVVKNLTQGAEALGYWIKKTHGGLFSKGFPDLICLKHGITFCLEVKAYDFLMVAKPRKVNLLRAFRLDQIVEIGEMSAHNRSPNFFTGAILAIPTTRGILIARIDGRRLGSLRDIEIDSLFSWHIPAKGLIHSDTVIPNDGYRAMVIPDITCLKERPAIEFFL